jgi:DNA-binding CsgD family transcriptional regulator
MKHKIYALYKGETLLADGTTKEIAEKMGIRVRSVLYYRTPAYQRRAKKVRNRRVLVCLDD